MPTLCSVNGCNNQHLAKGFCQKHYQRLRMTGDPLGLRHRGKALDFIHKTVLKHTTDDCLEWPYSRNELGYGITQFGQKGPQRRVSRIVCELVYGPQPAEKLEAAHWCGNSACVSPRHLRWATHRENEADKSRHGTRARGSQHGRSKLSEADVLAIRSQPNRQSKELAAEFGVTSSMICIIRRRGGWKHI